MTDGKDADSIDELRAFLEEKAQEPNPTRKLSLKATITALRPQLVQLKDAGYTDAQIADLLKEKGIVINAGTLKNYMSQTRNTTSAPTSNTRRTKSASPDKRNENSSATPAPSTGNTVETAPEPSAASAGTGTEPSRKPDFKRKY